MNTTCFLRFATPLGPMYATSDGRAITGIYFEGGRHAPAVQSDWIEERTSPVLAECARQVRDYCAGRRRAFALALAPHGTDFQRRVWDEIARIPYGATLSYGELAARAGAPGSARAAGAATGRNPLSIVVPCHRVVGSGGELTGYAGGVDRKRDLLALEVARQAVLA
jgi:methylated-DNA-[protein]-cysteine S-methyltransferase